MGGLAALLLLWCYRTQTTRIQLHFATPKFVSQTFYTSHKNKNINQQQKTLQSEQTKTH